MTTAEVWIPLSQGKVTVIDFDDFEKVRPYKWRSMGRRVYGYRTDESGKQLHKLLHQVVFGEVPEGLEIGHKDGDGFNNRGGNLHAITHQQNMQGPMKKRASATSRYRGVHWRKDIKRWPAFIGVNKKSIYLGSFETEEDAARAYDEKALALFGEHATLNFPERTQ